MAGFQVDQVAAEFYDGQIVLEKLRKVERTSSLVALLVKIDCPDAVLVLFEIRSHLHDVIVGPHVTEEPDEATLVELDEFLGQTNFVQIFAFEEVIDEVISRNPDDMLFDEGFAIDVKVDFVGGKELFEFQSVDAGCVRFLDVKVVVVVVVLIDDADPEGPGVSESAVVNPVHVKVR